jgi:hypothetical protein
VVQAVLRQWHYFWLQYASLGLIWKPQLSGRQAMRAILLALAMVTGPFMAAHAQVVEGVGFYRQIVDEKTKEGVRTVEATRAIPNDLNISLRQLPWRMDPESKRNRRTVYAAATLASATIPSQIVFMFRRVVSPGDPRCEEEQDQVLISDKDMAKLKKSGLGRDAAAVSKLLTNAARDTISGLEISYGSVKYKVVNTEPNLRTYYDYRFVHCPGQVQVWVTDNRLTVLGPTERNPGIILPIVD